jgi:hypothetical protein
MQAAQISPPDAANPIQKIDHLFSFAKQRFRFGDLLQLRLKRGLVLVSAKATGD